MFGGRFSSSIGTVGIEIGSRSIRLLQLRRHGGRLLVVGAGEEAIDVRGDAPNPAVRQHDDPGRAAAANGDRNAPSSKNGKKGPGPQGDGPGNASKVQAESAAADASGLAERLRLAFTAGGFTGRKCVVSLPRTEVCVQSVRLPKMPDAELESAAAWEASQRFGFDRAAMEVSVLRTGATLQSGENREEVLLVAAPHSVIHQRLAPILEAGFRPTAVDTGFGALARLFSQHLRRESDRQHVRAIVDVGHSGTTIMILRGDQVAFCKPINVSGLMFDKAVADHLQMQLAAAADLRAVRMAQFERAHARRAAADENPHSELGAVIDRSTDRAVYEAVRPLMGDLTKEVTLCLRYYGVTFRGKPPSLLILTGSDGLEPRLGEMLHQACKIPVQFDDFSGPASGVSGGSGDAEASGSGPLASIADGIRATLNRDCGPGARWAVAAGLSMRGLAVARPQRAAEPAQTRGAAA